MIPPVSASLPAGQITLREEPGPGSKTIGDVVDLFKLQMAQKFTIARDTDDPQSIPEKFDM
jgi:hypothetical protein